MFNIFKKFLLTFVHSQADASQIKVNFGAGRYKGILVVKSGVHSGSVTVASLTDKILVEAGKKQRVNAYLSTIINIMKFKEGIISETTGTTFSFGVFIPVHFIVDKARSASIQISGIFSAATSNAFEIYGVYADASEIMTEDYIMEDTDTHSGRKTKYLENTCEVYFVATTATNVSSLTLKTGSGEQLVDGSYTAIKALADCFSQAVSSPSGILMSIKDYPEQIIMDVDNSASTEYKFTTLGFTGILNDDSNG